jgi:cytochrome b561
MQWRSTATRYGLITGLFHWIIVAGVIAEYFLAEMSEKSEGAGALGPTGLHASIGLTILSMLPPLRVTSRRAPARATR